MTGELNLGEVVRVERDITRDEASAIAARTSGDARTYWALAYDATSTDRHGTRMTPDAFRPSADSMEFPILLFHETNRFPVAKPVAIEYKADGLHVGFQFATTPEARVAESLVSDGFLRGVSVGFIPQAGSVETINGEPTVVFSKADLLELSLTPTPSSKGALVDLTRSVGEDIENLDEFIALFDIDENAAEEVTFEEPAAGNEEAPVDDAQTAAEPATEQELLDTFVDERQAAIDTLRALGVAEDILAQLRTTEDSEPEISETAATVITDRERALRNLSLLRRFSR